MREEEKKLKEKANTLANWSKEWSNRFNK